MKYFIARIQFYVEAQKRLFPMEHENPIDLIERLLRENPKYEPKGRDIGLLFGNFILESDKLVAVKVGRSKEGKKEDYDIKTQKFLETPMKKYPSALLLWDADEQIIIIERKTTIFPDINSFFKALENYFNLLLLKYDIRVTIIPLTREIDFWKIINKYNKIYSVSFDLKMPNFLGSTNKSVKEILDHIKKENNGSELSTKISNENGNLTLHRDSWISPLLNWIKLGGGSWLIQCAKKRGVKEKIKSTDNALKIEGPKTTFDESVEGAKTLIDYFKNEYINDDDLNTNND